MEGAHAVMGTGAMCTSNSCVHIQCTQSGWLQEHAFAQRQKSNSLICQQKSALLGAFERYPGGESGIRTRGGLLTHTRFPGVRLKPLIHLSAWQAGDCSGSPACRACAFHGLARRRLRAAAAHHCHRRRNQRGDFRHVARLQVDMKAPVEH